MLSENTKGGKSLPTLLKEKEVKEAFQEQFDILGIEAKVLYVDLSETEDECRD